MTDACFPPDPPDRPGWWRCKWIDEIWRPMEVVGNPGSWFICDGHLMIPVNSAMVNGWQFAGRVEMPGEE